MIKTKLNVPLIQAPEGSGHCQIGTTLMLLAFYNDEMSYEDLVEELREYMFENGGMHSQGTVSFFANRGYQTFFSHHDLGVLAPEIENRTEADLDYLKSYLSKLDKSKEDGSYQIDKLKLDTAYIEKGGRYSTKLSTLKMVDDFLERGIPVELGVRYKALHLKPQANNNNHAIVVTAKTEQSYMVNDPDPKTQGQYEVSFDRLLHAWYNTGVQLKAVWR